MCIVFSFLYLFDYLGFFGLVIQTDVQQLLLLFFSMKRKCYLLRMVSIQPSDRIQTYDATPRFKGKQFRLK